MHTVARSKWRPQCRTDGHQPANVVQASTGRSRFIDVVISASTEYAPSFGSEDTASYVMFVEQSILSFLQQSDTGTTQACDALLGQTNDSSVRVGQILDLCATIVVIINKLSEHLSVDDITQSVFAHFKTEPEGRDQYNTIVQQLVFACIGWTTELFTAHPRTADNDLRVIDPRYPTQTRQMSGACKRPLGICLRALDVIPFPCPFQRPSNVTLATISASNLDYTAIRRLGNVSIVWVDEIGSHCHFDSVTKRLFIFRFPSRCVQDLRSKKWSVLLHKLTCAHTCRHKCDRITQSAIEDHLREILLSYRLLFGHDDRSRKLCRRKLFGKDKVQDSVLYALCTRKFIEKDKTFPKLQEREVYEPSIDFPLLGSRLAKLQDYILLQQPRSWGDVLQDRRNSQWSFNFWAVVIIGGATIILGLLQVILSALQLAVTIKPPHGK